MPVCGFIDHVVSLGTCSYQYYKHNYVMSMNYFEPNFYLTVRLIMHSGVESVGICCSSQWWLWACWGRNVDSVKFVLPCRRRDRIHPFFSVRIFWLYTLKSNIVPTNNGRNISIMQLQTRNFYLVPSVSGEVVQLTQIMFIGEQCGEWGKQVGSMNEVTNQRLL